MTLKVFSSQDLDQMLMEALQFIPSFMTWNSNLLFKQLMNSKLFSLQILI